MTNRAKLLVAAGALLYGALVSAAAPEATPITVDAAAKKSESGGVGMEIVFKGIAAEGIDMGHHLRGRLIFPAEADGRLVLGPAAKSFQLRLGGAQGEPQAVFPWSIARR